MRETLMMMQYSTELLRIEVLSLGSGIRETFDDDEVFLKGDIEYRSTLGWSCFVDICSYRHLEDTVTLTGSRH